MVLSIHITCIQSVEIILKHLEVLLLDNLRPRQIAQNYGHQFSEGKGKGEVKGKGGWSKSHAKGNLLTPLLTPSVTPSVSPYGVKPNDNCNLWVGDLPLEADTDLVHHVFSVYGTVAECKVLIHYTCANE